MDCREGGERSPGCSARLNEVVKRVNWVPYDFRPRRLCNDHSRNTHTSTAKRGHGGSHRVDKGPVSQRHSTPRPFPLHCARGAVHKPACLLAHVGDSVVGVVLSLEEFCHVGSSFLFFGGQLFHSRRKRSSSQTNVANDGPGRKRDRRADVRTLRELPVRHSDAAR